MSRLLVWCLNQAAYFLHFLKKFGENKKRQSMWCGDVWVDVVASFPREIWAWSVYTDMN